MTDDPSQQIHIETVDFKGNPILCTVLQWHDHIIGKKRHIQLADAEDLVIAVLQNPATGMRYHDTFYPERMNYYGEGGVTRYTKVTVEFENSTCSGLGHIVTAYPVDKMKPGETPEW